MAIRMPLPNTGLLSWRWGAHTAEPCHLTSAPDVTLLPKSAVFVCDTWQGFGPVFVLFSVDTWQGFEVVQGARGAPIGRPTSRSRGVCRRAWGAPAEPRATVSTRILGKTMRDAVRHKERWKRRRTPTQDPSTEGWARLLALGRGAQHDHGLALPGRARGLLQHSLRRLLPPRPVARPAEPE